MELLAPVRRVQSHVLSDAHSRPARDDAPDLHLCRRDRLGKSESARYDRCAHYRAEHVDLRAQCAPQLEAWRHRGRESVARANTRMGYRVAAAELQLLSAAECRRRRSALARTRKQTGRRWFEP